MLYYKCVLKSWKNKPLTRWFKTIHMVWQKPSNLHIQNKSTVWWWPVWWWQVSSLTVWRPLHAVPRRAWRVWTPWIWGAISSCSAYCGWGLATLKCVRLVVLRWSCVGDGLSVILCFFTFSNFTWISFDTVGLCEAIRLGVVSLQQAFDR